VRRSWRATSSAMRSWCGATAIVRALRGAHARLRDVAEDAVQDALVRACRSAARTVGARKFGGWLFAVLRNAASPSETARREGRLPRTQPRRSRAGPLRRRHGAARAARSWSWPSAVTPEQRKHRAEACDGNALRRDRRAHRGHGGLLR